MSLKDQLLQIVSRYTGGRVGYDDGGVVSTSDILREMTPGAITRDLRPGPDVRAQVRNRAMAGRPLPGDRELLAEYLANDLPRRREIMAEQLGPEDALTAADAVARFVAPPIPGYNFPTMEEGRREFEGRVAHNMERRAGMSEGDRLLDLAKEYGLEAAPYAVPMAAQRAAPLVAAAARAVPKSAYASLPLAAMFAPSEAGDPTAGDPRLKEIASKEAEIKALRTELTKLGSTNMRSNLAREKASEPFLLGIAAAQRRIDDLNREIREDAQKAAGAQDAERLRIRGEAADKRDAVLRDAPKSFSQEFQTASKYMPWAPLALGAATGLMLGIPRAASSQLALREWDKALGKASNTKLAGSTRTIEADVARNIAKDWPVKDGFENVRAKAAQYTAPAAIGAVEGAVVPNLPHAYNILKVDEENPERKALQTYYRNLQEGDPEQARVKKLLDDETVLPKGNPAFESAHEYFTNPLTQMLPRTAAGAMEGAAATMPGTTVGTAFSPWNKTLAVRHARTDALPKSFGRDGLTPKDPGSPPQALTPLPETPPPLPPTRQPPALPPPLPQTAATAPPPGASATPSIAATTTSKPPVELPAWAGTPPPGITVPKGYHWDVNVGQPRKLDGTYGPMPKLKRGAARKDNKRVAPEDEVAGTVGGEKIPKKPDRTPTEDDLGFRASGGSVLGLARKYANGGVVAHGLVPGATPGRTDALDVEVPNGAYVLPADVVSALGEGNTLAGAEAWKEILPPTRGDPYANGGTVPIRISDGEIVVNPDQVAALGGGDLKKGHLVLDHAVKKVRADHIAKLKSLPPPATS